MTWTPQIDYDSSFEDRATSAIFQAIGAASSPTLWDDQGVFISERAVEIAEGLIEFLRANPLPVMKIKKPAFAPLDL